MRILLLADIHGNLPALNAVLEAADVTGYDALWCLGDIVGYGPFPNECARLIREKASRTVLGNHDAKVISARKIEQLIDQKKEPYKIFIFSWTHRMLEPDAAAYLRALPGQECVTIAGKKVLLVHGSPEGMDDGLTEHTPLPRLESLARKAQVRVILCGHTHGAFVREAPESGALFVNPGSVGRPFDGDARASFATMEILGEKVDIRLHRVAYDMEPVIEAMQRAEFPVVLVKAFAASTSPADVMPDGVKGDLIGLAQELGCAHGYERPHAFQVARLALVLFDALADLHGYGMRPRALLQAAALLHDVGLVRGADGHHKASRDIILADRTLPLSDRERVIVALVARYHRRAMPEEGHRHFSSLPDRHRQMVERLAALLRLADGLDRTHQALVREVALEAAGDVVTIKLGAEAPLDAEIGFGRAKSDLFVRIFGKKVEFRAA